jgi:GTP-dependent phosphoenolpyruvate carboxykinase
MAGVQAAFERNWAEGLFMMAAENAETAAATSAHNAKLLPNPKARTLDLSEFVRRYDH